MKCSEGMLTFKGEPPGPELFKVTVDNGGGPVDLQDIRVAKIDLAAKRIAHPRFVDQVRRAGAVLELLDRDARPEGIASDRIGHRK